MFTKLIERNTTIPTRKSETFSTAADNQTSVEIKVYQGERAMAAHNRLLGVFQLGNIPPAPRGVPQIEVTFDIDANGILNVTAKDKATNNEQKITITSSSGLSKDEVEKMAKDAEVERGRRSSTRRGRSPKRNLADQMVYNTEKMLKEHRSKISEADAKAVEDALEETKKAVQSGNLDEIRAAKDKLTQASHKLAEAMYRSSAGPQGGPTGAGRAMAQQVPVRSSRRTTWLTPSSSTSTTRSKQLKSMTHRADASPLGESKCVNRRFALWLPNRTTTRLLEWRAGPRTMMSGRLTAASPESIIRI